MVVHSTAVELQLATGNIEKAREELMALEALDQWISNEKLEGLKQRVEQAL